MAKGRACASDGDPDEHNDNVKALALATVVLVRPHAILLLVPISTGRRVHATAADVGLAVSGSGGLGRRRDVRLLGTRLTALGLVKRRSRDQVLHDGAVARELEAGGRRALGSRLGNYGLENRRLRLTVSLWAVSPRASRTNDDGRVPFGSLGVIVKVRASNRARACLGLVRRTVVDGMPRCSLTSVAICLRRVKGMGCESQVNMGSCVCQGVARTGVGPVLSAIVAIWDGRKRKEVVVMVSESNGR